MNTLLVLARSATVAIGLVLALNAPTFLLTLTGILIFGAGTAIVGWNGRGDRDRERYAQQLRTLLNGKTTPTHITTNPECAHGKHDDCDGTGWDIDLNKTTQCPCFCHANLHPKQTGPDTLNP